MLDLMYKKVSRVIPEIEWPFHAPYIEEINKLKKEKNAVILAHNYQTPEIFHCVADIVGDSLKLAREAKNTDADIIVMCGVNFMAETAKIMNPSKTVLIPDPLAGCSLADSCPPTEFKKFIKNHPEAVIVTYINCSAEIKAMSDIVCTSSNAKKVINSIPKNKSIVFAPDRNLGEYLIKETGRNMILWDGACLVHEAFSLERIITLAKQYPKAKFIAHPESRSPILDIANYIGSTSALLKYIETDPSNSYIVATESGIIHQMKKTCPDKTFIPAPVEDETCACSECAYMKLNTLKKLYNCLLNESPQINLNSDLISRSKISIDRMLALR